MKKNALGRGLSALIPDDYVISGEVVSDKKSKAEQQSNHGVVQISIKDIRHNQDQPRYLFDETKMEELAASIKEQGVIQPIIVKNKGAEGKHELVCGERRLRAAQRAGIEKIPAIIKEIATSALLEIALIENIQREDLNPIEEAEAFFKLQERGLSHEEIAQKVGKNRTTIVNILRLLKLPKEILKLLAENKLREGHARALLSLPTVDYQIKLAKRCLEEGLSVRQIEEIVKRKSYQKRPAKRLRKIDSHIMDLERKLEEKLGSKVRVFAGKSKGRIEVKYYTLGELDRILSVLGIAVD